MGEMQGEQVQTPAECSCPQTNPAAASALWCLCFLEGRGQLLATRAVAGAGSSCHTQSTQVFLLPEPLAAGTDLKENPRGCNKTES